MTDTRFNCFSRRITLALGAIAVCIAPATSSVAADRTNVATAFSDLGPALIEPPAEANAVDLTSFKPEREVAPQPAPEPAVNRGPVLRTLGTRVASYYGKRFHGRLTANGERFNMNAMTAAHKTLPFGTRVLVTNPRNGKSVTVRINDRGPFIKGRHIDLSRRAAKKLGIISSGHARVKLDIVR